MNAVVIAAKTVPPAQPQGRAAPGNGAEGAVEDVAEGADEEEGTTSFDALLQASTSEMMAGKESPSALADSMSEEENSVEDAEAARDEKTEFGERERTEDDSDPVDGALLALSPATTPLAAPSAERLEESNSSENEEGSTGGDHSRNSEDQSSEADSNRSFAVNRAPMAISDAKAAPPQKASLTTEITTAMSQAEETRGDSNSGSDSFSQDSGNQDSGNLQHTQSSESATGSGRTTRFDLNLARSETPASNPNALTQETQERTARALPELPARNESRIISQVRILTHQGGGVARFELHPPHLGDLRVHVTVTHDAVQLHLLADRGVVADVLQRHISELRATLQSQGVQITRADVDVRDQGSPDSRSESSAWGQRERSGPQNSPRHLSAGDPLATRTRSLQAAQITHVGAVNVHV